MQVRVDDDVDVFGGDSGSREIRQQLRGLAVELDHALRQLVAHAGFDQDVLLAGVDQQRVESGCT